MMWLIVFALSFVVCLYIYFGYPLLIFAASSLRPRPVRKKEMCLSVTVVIPAHNEEEVIGEKLENTLGADYPHDLLEILVVSDGSTDATEAIVESCMSERVRLVKLERGGKAFALNQGAAAATGEVLVLTDANSLIQPGALKALVGNFADPEVGGVCGRKKYFVRKGGDTTEQGENLYWRYDQWQKGLESKLGSIFAADGTLYALRKSLYVPIEDPAQADDIAISTRIVLQGYRLLYEPEAIAFEEAPEEGLAEFRRKVRVTNHSVRALLNLKSALWRSGFYSVELLSHKLIRHLIPFFLLPLFISNIYVAVVHPLFQGLLTLQVLFYLLGVLGFLLRTNSLGRARIFSVPYYFSLVNVAAFLGVVSILRGNRLSAWTPRSGLGKKEAPSE